MAVILKSLLIGLLVSSSITAARAEPCQADGTCAEGSQATEGNALLQQSFQQTSTLVKEEKLAVSEGSEAKEADDESDEVEDEDRDEEEDDDQEADGDHGEEEEPDQEDIELLKLMDADGEEVDSAVGEEDLVEGENAFEEADDVAVRMRDDDLDLGEDSSEEEDDAKTSLLEKESESGKGGKGRKRKGRGGKGKKCRPLGTKCKPGHKCAPECPAPGAEPAPKPTPKPSEGGDTTGKVPVWAKQPEGIDYSKKVTVGCAAEKALRKAINTAGDHTGRMGPQILRMIFHDAVDANNLLLKNKDSGKWEPIGSDGEKYGGVDLCLYSPLSKGDHGSPEPSHNRNLPSSFGWAQQLCNQFCQKGKRKEGVCRSMPDCIVDMTVLGSIVTIEAVGGPKIPMTWGRKKGTCKKVIETPFSKDPKKLETYVNEPALAGAPSLTGIDDGPAFRSAFKKLGFNPTDQAALMGAHTFGKLQVCAGGLNGVEAGPFCVDPTKMDPPLTEKNISPACEPKLGVVSHCWVKGKWGLVPTYATAGKIHGHGTKNGFGDGGFFDRTPTRFDNDYFKLFADEEYDGKENCCGKVKNGGCHRGGRGMAMENRKTMAKIGPVCNFQWCRSDRKGRTHMKSVKAWHEAPHDFVKKGYHHGVTKRMIRLAGDWALLAHDETKAAVKKFAADQDAFFDAFTVAWGKVINKGYDDLPGCDPNDDYAPTVKLAASNPNKGDAPFQGDGQGTGCRDKHKKCHLLKNKPGVCKKRRWAMRCPYTCKQCGTDNE